MKEDDGTRAVQRRYLLRHQSREKTTRSKWKDEEETEVPKNQNKKKIADTFRN